MLKFLFVRNNEDMIDMDCIASITRPSKVTIIVDTFGNTSYIETGEKQHTTMCKRLLDYQLSKKDEK